MSAIARVVAMLTLSGALIGFTISLFVPHRYAARAELAFIAAPGVTHESAVTDATSLLSTAEEITLLPQSLEIMIRRSAHFKDRLYLEALPELIREVRENLTIAGASLDGGMWGARIEFEDDDADSALDLVREILSQLGDNAARAAGNKKVSDVVRIVRIPSASLTGITPWLLTGIGVAAGLVAGLGIWIFASAGLRKG